MLVLTRKLNEAILIGDDIEIRILKVKSTQYGPIVHLGINAPKNISVDREEVRQRKLDDPEYKNQCEGNK